MVGLVALLAVLAVVVLMPGHRVAGPVAADQAVESRAIELVVGLFEKHIQAINLLIILVGAVFVLAQLGLQYDQRNRERAVATRAEDTEKKLAEFIDKTNDLVGNTGGLTLQRG